jgi:hypothetical protein
MDLTHFTPVSQDFKHTLTTCAIRGFDINHQLWRLRLAKHMQDAEVELIMRTMVDAVQTYDQVVEVRCCGRLARDGTLKYPPQLLSLTPPHNGGLLPLSFGLFHQQEVVRDLTVDLFTQLRMFPVSSSPLHSSLFCILILQRVYSGWRAVFTGPQPLPALCLRPASSCARVARRWYERCIWFRSLSATTSLF